MRRNSDNGRAGMFRTGVDMTARFAAFALMFYITYGRYTLVGAIATSGCTIAICLLSRRTHDGSVVGRAYELYTATLSALTLTVLIGVATSPHSVLASMLIASCVCFLTNVRAPDPPRKPHREAITDETSWRRY